MYAKCSDVGSSLTAHPEYTQVSVIVELEALGLVDGSYTEDTLDGRDQWRALEESTGEGLEGALELGLTALNCSVEADDTDVLLSSTLLGLNKTCGTV